MSSAYQWVCGQLWILELQENVDQQIAVQQGLIALIITNSVLSVGTTVLNFSIFIVLFNLSTLPRGTRIILLNLTASDCLTGVLAQPLYISFLVLQWQGDTICLLARAATFVCFLVTTVSFTTLLVATTERYLSIFHPYVHQTIVESIKSNIIVVLVWMFAAGVTISGSFAAIRTEIYAFLAVFQMTGCIWITFVYIKIYHLVFSIRKNAEIQENSLHGRARGSKSSTDITFVIVLLCVACYSPFVIKVYAITFGNQAGNSLTVNYTKTLQLANSLLNPICYCVRNKEIRKAIVKFWKPRCCL